MSFEHLIRDVADFPTPGIVFKDIAPLLGSGSGLREAVQAMAAPWRSQGVDIVAGIESRGFILGTGLALELGLGFVPLRKPGKLPGRVLGVDYALEYGSDRLEVQADGIAAGARVLLVDDVLATGGTLAAAARLLEGAGAAVAGGAVLVEIGALGGRARWTVQAPLQATLCYR